jgi:hypothetical protein
MGKQNDLGTLFRQLMDRRRHALDARRVGNLAVRDGNVEIDADKHTLACDVGEIVECLESRHETTRLECC